METRYKRTGCVHQQESDHSALTERLEWHVGAIGWDDDSCWHFM